MEKVTEFFVGEVEEVEVQEERARTPKYLPSHLGPMGAWTPIRISNFDAAIRAGKGCIAGRPDFKLEAPRPDSSQTSSSDANKSSR